MCVHQEHLEVLEKLELKCLVMLFDIDTSSKTVFVGDFLVNDF